MKSIIVQCIDLEPATAAKAKEMEILHIDLGDTSRLYCNRSSWQKELGKRRSCSKQLFYYK